MQHYQGVVEQALHPHARAGPGTLCAAWRTDWGGVALHCGPASIVGQAFLLGAEPCREHICDHARFRSRQRDLCGRVKQVCGSLSALLRRCLSWRKASQEYVPREYVLFVVRRVSHASRPGFGFPIEPARCRTAGRHKRTKPLFSSASLSRLSKSSLSNRDRIN